MNADVVRHVLAFLSPGDDWKSFDADLLARRRKLTPEEWTVYAIEAAAGGDLAKVKLAEPNLPADETRWVAYAAASNGHSKIVRRAAAQGYLFDPRVVAYYLEQRRRDTSP